MGLFFGRDSTMPYALRGTLQGHNGAITSIATNRDTPDVLISASRDKTIISWTLNDTSSADDAAGVPKRSLQGHSHFVEDVVLSSDGAFALSCSWDRTLRLWDLKNGVTTKTFVGHEKDVLSVAFSADNRQIVSASRDRTIKLWNTLGECKVPLPTTTTPSGSAASASPPMFPTLSLFLAVGIVLSRFGISLTSSSSTTFMATLVTSTPSLSPPTVSCAPLVARTVT